ncbi:MAG TPA: helix-hairpin-helix domain-containing protein [Candidatus Dwaynia gallinarum]|nr:helix-hairpin-helix domain-containing protein [Candidatus Dwaynia gallinarum]
MFKKENLLKYLLSIAIITIFLSVFLFYNISSSETEKQILSLNEFTHEEESNEIKIEDVQENIFVEIKGEVLNPNVYELEKGSIVRDLILISGGLTEIGDTSNINQARELQNGECIVVLSKQEILDMKNNSNEILKVDNVSSFNVESSFDDDKVNINTASKEELKTLSGIGDGLAEAIISYREENNGFNTIDDIKNVSRIGDKTFEKFKDKIIV